MKKITLFILLGLLLHCEAKTSKVSRFCDLNLNLDAGEYAQHGNWTIVLNKLTEKDGFITESHPIPPHESTNTTVPLELGDFNILSLNFNDANNLNPWKRKKELFINKNKKHIELSSFIGDQDIKVDLKDFNDEDNIAFASFYEQLNKIRREPGGYLRTGEDAKTFAIRFMQFTNDFIASHKSIDETLKHYLKIEGYNQSLFRDSRMSQSPLFSGNLYELYDSELILFDVLSEIILKQQIDKNFSRTDISQIISLENKISFINEKLTNPLAKDAMITKYIKDFRNHYIFKNETFQSDLKRFKMLVDKIKDAEQRDAAIASFEQTSFKAIGASFPTLELKDIKGNIITSQSLFADNKYVYIDLWASWCVPCIKEIPALKALEKEYANKNIKFVSISIDAKPEAWHKALAKYDLHGYQFHDQDNRIGKILNIQGIPRFLFYDPTGKLLSIDAPRPSSPDIQNMLNTYL